MLQILTMLKILKMLAMCQTALYTKSVFETRQSDVWTKRQKVCPVRAVSHSCNVLSGKFIPSVAAG